MELEDENESDREFETASEGEGQPEIYLAGPDPGDRPGMVRI